MEVLIDSLASARLHSETVIPRWDEAATALATDSSRNTDAVTPEKVLASDVSQELADGFQWRCLEHLVQCAQCINALALR